MHGARYHQLSKFFTCHLWNMREVGIGFVHGKNVFADLICLAPNILWANLMCLRILKFGIPSYLPYYFFLRKSKPWIERTLSLKRKIYILQTQDDDIDYGDYIDIFDRILPNEEIIIDHTDLYL
jgi:hypothetical protein